MGDPQDVFLYKRAIYYDGHYAKSQSLTQKQVIPYSLASDAINVTDDDNFALVVASQIQISVTLTGMVKTPLREPIVLTKQGGQPCRKLRRPSESQLKEGQGLCSILCC